MTILSKIKILLFTVIIVSSCQTPDKNSDSNTLDNKTVVSDTFIRVSEIEFNKRQPDPLCYIIRNEHLDYNSMFFEACKTCDSINIKRFITAGIDLNKKDRFGNTALMYLVAQPAESGNFKFVQLLLEKGAELNHVNIHGKTALTIARTFYNENGHSSDDSRNNCRIADLLRDFGGEEHDYIDYLVNNLSGLHMKEQKVIQEVKNKFRKFNNEKGNLKVREIKHDTDVNHRAYFSSHDSLKYYYNRCHYEIHYHDGDADKLTKKHYYFDDGFLYFYFEDFEDYLMKDKRQIRAYYSQDSLIALSIKEYDPWGMCIKTEDINSLINAKCDKKFYTYKDIMDDFEEDVKFVKDSLQITKNCW